MNYLSILFVGLLLLGSCEIGGKNKEKAEQAYNNGLKYYEAKNYSGALKTFTEAAGLRHTEAQYFLGRIYFAGKGTTTDHAQSISWFKKAADQGYVEAQFFLGSMYYSGLGIPQNYADALKWYRKAADQGRANAQFALGFMHGDGLGVPKDHAEALKWLRKAAQGDHVKANEFLRWGVEEFLKRN